MREIIIGLDDADYARLKPVIGDDGDVDVVRCEMCVNHSNRTGFCSIWMCNTPANGWCYRKVMRTAELVLRGKKHE